LHLDKQIAIQDELLSYKKSQFGTKQYATFEYKLINQLNDNKRILVNDDRSLLVYGYRDTNRDIIDTLLEKESNFKLPENFLASVDKTIIQSSEYNGFHISPINLIMSPSRIPIFWWNIKDEICEEIYFKKLRVFTIFNPAQFLQHFIDKGYLVELSKSLDKIKIVKINGNKKVELRNLGMLFDLITHGLMKTKHVVDMIDKFLDDSKNGMFPLNSGVDMIIQLHTFGKP